MTREDAQTRHERVAGDNAGEPAGLTKKQGAVTKSQSTAPALSGQQLAEQLSLLKEADDA